MKIVVFLIIIFNFFSNALLAQDRENVKKNALYITPGFIYSATITYENTVGVKDQKSSHLRFMYGRYAEFFGDEGNIFCVTFNRLNNWKKNSHFDWGFGIVVESIRKVSSSSLGGVKVFPAGNIGYRIQTPKGFLFRTGVGFPEAAYLSLGFTFGKYK
jgi:hypothetical protein